MERERAVENFREYLKIESVHPKPDYDGCVSYLKNLAKDLQLKSTIVNLDDSHPVIILTLEGQSPELPSLLLNSHMDVVPVYKENWDHDPFAAEMDDKGDIFARGAQDMKCVTIAQLEAIRRLTSRGVRLKRTVHLTVLPDEEVGSSDGMAKFVHTEAFKKLNVGFDLDEGVPSSSNELIIFKNEKSSWKVDIHCPGTCGHGSLLHPNTAGEKLRVVLDRFMTFRKQEADKVTDFFFQGDVTSINLTSLKGGIQNNVVPPEFVAGFDIRIAPDADHKELENWIQDVCKAAGENVCPEYLQKNTKAPLTNIESNPFILALVEALTEMNIKYRMVNCTGATDARFARQVGVEALGLSPFLNTKLLVHSDNEYMNAKEFLDGINRYEKIIETLANV